MKNPEKKCILILAIVILIIIAGCLQAGASIDTYSHADILNKDVKAIAILPHRNTSENPGAGLLIDVKIKDGLSETIPEIKFIDAQTSSRLIGNANLTTVYTNLISEYEISGITDPTKLKRIGNALNVAAILLGRVVELAKLQGGAGLESQTYLEVIYYILSTRSGKSLWQSKTTAFDWAPGWDPPPPFENVVDMAVEKIVSEFPMFGMVVIK